MGGLIPLIVGLFIIYFGWSTLPEVGDIVRTTVTRRVGGLISDNIDYDYTADKTTGEYCYKFENPNSAVLFKLWFDKDSPKKTSSKVHQKCPECGHTF